MDLALNNLQRLCHKTQQTKPNQTIRFLNRGFLTTILPYNSFTFDVDTSFHIPAVMFGAAAFFSRKLITQMILSSALVKQVISSKQ